MSDHVSQDLSDDNGLENEHLVPVSESIRYRKRAQTAEQKLAEIDGQLRESSEQNKRLASEIDAMRAEKKLSTKLISMGVSDLETALLVARERMASSDGEVDIDSTVEAIKKEKGHLFGRSDHLAIPGRTLPVRDKTAGSRSVLDKAAREAAGSGSRRDVQEYMRVRRNYV